MELQRLLIGDRGAFGRGRRNDRSCEILPQGLARGDETRRRRTRRRGAPSLESQRSKKRAQTARGDTPARRRLGAPLRSAPPRGARFRAPFQRYSVLKHGGPLGEHGARRAAPIEPPCAHIKICLCGYANLRSDLDHERTFDLVVRPRARAGGETPRRRFSIRRASASSPSTARWGRRSSGTGRTRRVTAASGSKTAIAISGQQRPAHPDPAADHRGDPPRVLEGGRRHPGDQHVQRERASLGRLRHGGGRLRTELRRRALARRAAMKTERPDGSPATSPARWGRRSGPPRSRPTSTIRDPQRLVRRAGRRLPRGRTAWSTAAPT